MVGMGNTPRSMDVFGYRKPPKELLDPLPIKGPLPEHVRAGQPGAENILVINAATGEEVSLVQEVHTGEGWLIRCVEDPVRKGHVLWDDENNRIKTERLQGSWVLRRRED